MNKEEQAAEEYLDSQTNHSVDQAFLAGVRWARENPGWVRVDERLPTAPGYYLVVKEVMPEQERKRSCSFWTGERWDTIFAVEHWLDVTTLPEAP